MEKKVLLNDAEIERTITRIAREISEKVDKIENLALLGIRSRGAYLVRRIVKKIETAAGLAPHFGEIDITPYRDDLASPEAPDRSPLSIAIDDKTVVLIDDVINTGRTARAALDLVTRLGKPAKILLAVLVDRGSRQLPIRADIVGKNIQVEASERINVLLKESDGFDRVTVTPRPREGVSGPVS
jgi:pyrimidine operon attenuation protein / uracil phosphoribosyltransferase